MLPVPNPHCARLGGGWYHFCQEVHLFEVANESAVDGESQRGVNKVISITSAGKLSMPLAEHQKIHILATFHVIIHAESSLALPPHPPPNRRHTQCGRRRHGREWTRNVWALAGEKRALTRPLSLPHRSSLGSWAVRD